jgi:hypothetical protein
MTWPLATSMKENLSTWHTTTRSARAFHASMFAVPVRARLGAQDRPCRARQAA